MIDKDWKYTCTHQATVVQKMQLMNFTTAHKLLMRSVHSKICWTSAVIAAIFAELYQSLTPSSLATLTLFCASEGGGSSPECFQGNLMVVFITYILDRFHFSSYPSKIINNALFSLHECYSHMFKSLKLISIANALGLLQSVLDILRSCTKPSINCLNC